MARKSYLGGSTIIGPRDDPYRLENTPHHYTSGDDERPRLVFWGKMEDDLFEELEGFSFDYISELFCALQHAFLYQDLDAIKRIAEADEFLGNYTLRVMNKVMIGRKFRKQKGKIVIRKEGRLEWNTDQVIAVYRALLAAQDPEIDEIPEVHPAIKSLIKEQAIGDG